MVSECSKNASGEPVAGTVQKMGGFQEFKIPATIDDPTVLCREIEDVAQELGYTNHMVRNSLSQRPRSMALISSFAQVGDTTAAGLHGSAEEYGGLGGMMGV